MNEITDKKEMAGLLDDLVKDNVSKNRKTDDFMVFSLEAVGLYPANDIDICSELIANRFVRCGLKVDGVDYGWVATYVASCCTPKEIKERGLQ